MSDSEWTWDSARRRPRALEELADLAVNPGLLRALVSRNLKVRYKRSFLGFAWSMLHPAAMMLVLSLVFSQAFVHQPAQYPAYLLAGLLAWSFFAQTTQWIIAEGAAGVDLWRRVRMPKTVLAMASALSGLINLGLAVVPLLVLVAYLRRPLGLALLSVPLTMACLAAFTLGLALLVASAALYFPDVADLWTVIISAWLFATPVIYPLSILPPALQRAVRLNPLALFVDAFRAPFYSGASPSLSAITAMIAVAAAALAVGWIVFCRCADVAPRHG